MLTGTEASSFDIDDTTGQIKVGTGTTLNHEGTNSYTVTVTVSDGRGAGNAVDPLVDTRIEVTITVTDVNEAPTITGLPSKDYPENGDTSVATYIAADPENDSIIWSLTGDDARVFSITGGVLTFKESPDFEDPADSDTNNEYSVTVIASDGSLTDDLDVTITVTNEDELGEIRFSSVQPQARTGLVATLTDPDIIKSYDTWLWGDFFRQGQLVYH